MRCRPRRASDSASRQHKQMNCGPRATGDWKIRLHSHNKQVTEMVDRRSLLAKVIFLFLFLATTGTAFIPSTCSRLSRRIGRCSVNNGNNRGPTLVSLVTEDDVIELVEKAEDLWGRVETLRKESEALSLQAEGVGTEAEAATKEAEASLKTGSISVSKMTDAQEAQNKALDLGSLLEAALRKSEEADEVEVLAEEALAASERALEQYLIDFPEAAQ